MVGCPGNTSTAPGKAIYYEWKGSSWTRVFTAEGAASESFGSTVAIISPNVFAVGGPAFGGTTGVVRAYSVESGSASQIGSDIVGQLGERFGTTMTGAKD